MNHADELGSADAEAQKSFDDLDGRQRCRKCGWFGVADSGFCPNCRCGFASGNEHGDSASAGQKAYWNFRNAFDSKLTIAELVAIHDDPRNHPLRRTAALDEAEARQLVEAAAAKDAAALRNLE